MSMIFIGGSREIFELPEPAIARIGAIVGAEHGVLIGDALGVDAEVQSLLAGYRYEHVGVFHAGREPRNNLGDWAAYHVPSSEGAHGYLIHAARDQEMARRADFGLMIWDGASPGTAANVLRLAMANKPCVIYDLARGSFATTHNVDDWCAMLRHAGLEIRRHAETRMTPDERLALPG